MEIYKDTFNTYNINIESLYLESSRHKFMIDILSFFDIPFTYTKSNILFGDTIHSVELYSDWYSDAISDTNISNKYKTLTHIHDQFIRLILYLETRDIRFTHFDFDSMIVINTNLLVPLNVDDMYTIYENDVNTITYPYNKNNRYLPIEMRDDVCIPFQVSHKTLFNSIALILYDILAGLDTLSDHKRKLYVIHGTNIYWFLINNLH